MRIRASAAARATGGTLHGADVDLDGASFDSRTLRPGELFVALVAERDGHEFVDAAAARGAGAALVQRPTTAPVPVIEVGDTAAALLALAAWARDGLAATVVGITGSVGKTSTKDLVRAAVGAGRRVAANERSFNNEQGLPVTVLGAPDDTEVLVLEMGMRARGEITQLCAVGRPDIGVVTAVAASHTETLGSLDEVARAKAELVDALPGSGAAVLNHDDERVLAMRDRTTARVLTYGAARGADVRIEGLVLDALARPRFDLRTPWGSATVELAASGAHMASNAAAAVAVAGLVGVDVAAAAAALGAAPLSAMRMQIVPAASGGVVINDAYNANPTSMTAALRSLAAVAAERRVAVLGAMAELDDPEAAHRQVAATARELGIELVAVGTDRYGSPPVDDAAVGAAVGPVVAGVAVLVKASRAVGLERLVADLAAS
ncbi:MAG TPA: UDP-N-acetylmuramoyl-tripeptide--D-alanyl-D-alanine ligase [Ilumatobacteraceae bacterium]|nr:UDP-N-acetylmuramoyl-tripeptide--D-alanyl-D-alanine ligase [Ilumatobacteraceae bacterium]